MATDVIQFGMGFMEVLPGFTAFYIPKSFYKYNGVKLYSK
jgi:hypothetical protein